MIEFKGELTGESRKFLIKLQQKGQIAVAIILTILFVVPTFIAAFAWDYIAFIALLPLGMFIIPLMFPPDKSTQKLFMPKRVYIDLADKVIVKECEKQESYHMIDAVETVIDYGEWYYFIFELASRDLYFVCQKNLLSQGTLEEFESLFEGKIERV